MAPTKKTQGQRSVVLAGRPNVGKSTLFNRICGSRRAIVTSVAGTTRDVIRESVEWDGVTFELVDTGGLFGASSDPLREVVSEQGLRALEGADLIVLLVDGRDGVLPGDIQVAERARRAAVPIVLAVNKLDDRRASERVVEFHDMGIAPVVPIAAEHGLGIGDLLDEVVARVPGTTDVTVRSADLSAEIGVAIIGRPNVGKSSLVNLFARENRVLVDDTAGTTRDAVDTVIRWHGCRVRLVDTAGIRRPGRVARSGQVEAASVMIAKRAIQRVDVALVIVDASEPIAKQDAVIAGEAERAGCGLVIVANKWDLVKGRVGFAKEFDANLGEAMKFADFAPILHVSAVTGERAPKVMEMVQKVCRARGTHIATPELNRFFAQVTKRTPPRSPGKQEVKIQYSTQVGTKPPRFAIFTNTKTKFHFSYERFLKNRLRETFDFIGTPIRLRVRTRKVSRGQR